MEFVQLVWLDIINGGASVIAGSITVNVVFAYLLYYNYKQRLQLFEMFSNNSKKMTACYDLIVDIQKINSEKLMCLLKSYYTDSHALDEKLTHILEVVTLNSTMLQKINNLDNILHDKETK